jgi:hypothetical protein
VAESLFVYLLGIEKWFADFADALVLVHQFVETASMTGMTGSAANLLNLQQDGVIVAIHPNLFYFLDIAGSQPLGPEGVPGTAVKSGLADA